MTALVKRFGITVRQLRMGHGWTQDELAWRSGLDRSYVGEVERGGAVPSIVTVEKLADALQLEMTVLLAHCERVKEQRAAQLDRLSAIAR
ncbi:MAG: XRE family transcriptional regulator [Variovorax sp.]|jgi:transcriptional regulator with XRE-family HTH domain|nr:MAG: XRE family transcriptional regulator [Variovorax sp.]